MLLLTVMILLPFMSVSTVFAATPTNFTFHNEGSFEIDCGSYTLNYYYIQDGRVTDFTDNAGNPTQELAQIDGNRILTNEATGYSVQAPGHWTITADLQTGVVQEIGLVIHLNIPGKGIVALDAGKIIVDADGNFTFLAGPKLVDRDAVLCAALS